ncbi:hypothetical protein SAMD00019534_112750 [Acytostelium subglobosum LB1]|uniref:hypothetical protein n=1 Tax=Acytostelium subglobosum LB1 TaxID=1410327 RepID=UPI000644AA06|nr:hypothetical protein SAMD00019534_112750 [Acytostelium subglobosum LB1]GAM28099.1 hypothetical protein SAMD00019534_112750 [Acytostelium subglobosum LB1]|eukprot:XP_012749058.1 hypothetical protein SAMD00019534_112750 [Acytostelium subglobosum LB1]
MDTQTIQPSESVEMTIEERIRKQVEYYLSRDNLSNDKFLLAQMSPEMYIPISVIAGFNKIKSLTTDIELIIKSISNSSALILDDEKKLVRPAVQMKNPRNVLILRDIPLATTEEEIRAIFNSATQSITNVRYDQVGKMWFITFDTEENALVAHDITQNNTFKNEPIKARIKSETFVRSESAQTKVFPAAAELNGVPNGVVSRTQYYSVPPINHNLNQKWTRPVGGYPYGGWDQGVMGEPRPYDPTKSGEHRKPYRGPKDQTSRPPRRDHYNTSTHHHHHQQQQSINNNIIPLANGNRAVISNNSNNSNSNEQQPQSNSTHSPPISQSPPSTSTSTTSPPHYSSSASGYSTTGERPYPPRRTHHTKPITHTNGKSTTTSPHHSNVAPASLTNGAAVTATPTSPTSPTAQSQESTTTTTTRSKPHRESKSRNKPNNSAAATGGKSSGTAAEETSKQEAEREKQKVPPGPQHFPPLVKGDEQLEMKKRQWGPAATSSPVVAAASQPPAPVVQQPASPASPSTASPNPQQSQQTSPATGKSSNKKPVSTGQTQPQQSSKKPSNKESKDKPKSDKPKDSQPKEDKKATTGTTATSATEKKQPTLADIIQGLAPPVASPTTSATSSVSTPTVTSNTIPTTVNQSQQ